uniref:Uncharacterized protein n=1 Tax=Meloidogyne enterolobii TaxID=390850 RepID=A0A6V7XKZ1_MELEN|nr:unnamed protein product [Meloidogyne enterolobii]
MFTILFFLLILLVKSKASEGEHESLLLSFRNEHGHDENEEEHPEERPENQKQMVVYNPLKLKTNNPELELYKFIEAKINFFTKNKKYKGEIEKTLKKIKWYTTELNAEEFESIDKLGHENYEMLDKLNFGVLLKIRGICSNLWHYFIELNAAMMHVCSHEDFKTIFNKMLEKYCNLKFKVEEPKIYEENAAEEALKYLKKKTTLLKVLKN